MSSLVYRSHTATDFEADDASILSCAVNAKIGDLCALVI